MLLVALLQDAILALLKSPASLRKLLAIVSVTQRVNNAEIARSGLRVLDALAVEVAPLLRDKVRPLSPSMCEQSRNCRRSASRCFRCWPRR